MLQYVSTTLKFALLTSSFCFKLVNAKGGTLALIIILIFLQREDDHRVCRMAVSGATSRQQDRPQVASGFDVDGVDDGKVRNDNSRNDHFIDDNNDDDNDDQAANNARHLRLRVSARCHHQDLRRL